MGLGAGRERPGARSSGSRNWPRAICARHTRCASKQERRTRSTRLQACQAGLCRTEVRRHDPAARLPTSSAISKRRSSANQILDGEPRIDGRDTRTVRPIIDSHRRIAAHARLGAVHARRNAGARHRNAGHLARRADHRRAPGRVHASASCCITTCRRTRPARPDASVRPKRREIGHGRLAKRALLAVLPRGRVRAIRCASSPRSRNRTVALDGLGVRRLSRADGRRRADESARGRHRDGPHQGRQPLRGAVGHPGRRGPSR